VCQRLPVRSADRDSLAASPLIRTPSLPTRWTTRSSSASIMSRVRERGDGARRGASRGGKRARGRGEGEGRGEGGETRESAAGASRADSTISPRTTRFDASLLARSALGATRSRGLTPDHCMRCDYAARANPPTFAPTTRPRHPPLAALRGSRRRPTLRLASRAQPRSRLRGVVTSAYPVPAVFPIASRARFGHTRAPCHLDDRCSLGKERNFPMEMGTRDPVRIPLHRDHAILSTPLNFEGGSNLPRERAHAPRQLYWWLDWNGRTRESNGRRSLGALPSEMYVVRGPFSSQ